MVASVVGKIGRRMVKSRNTKGKRTDLARERAQRNLNKKRAETKVTKATKPTRGKPIPPKGPKPIPPKGPKPTPPINKGGIKKALKKFGVPGKIIAGVLALTAANKLSNKPKAKKAPAAKKETQMKKRFRAGPTAGSGLGGQRRSGTLRGKNVVANPPKRKNKDPKVDLKKRGPSGPRMTGFRK